MSSKSSQLEALLYADGGEMNKSDLLEALGIKMEELAGTISELKETLSDRGLSLVETDKALSLRTAQTHSDLIAQVQKKNLEKDLGDAGLEVLAIVLYKGSATKITIDHIRGVNSGGTLRNLTIRGLLDRSRWEKDARQTLFQPTAELLAHLGVTSQDDLPEHDKVQEELRQFEENTSQEEHANTE